MSFEVGNRILHAASAAAVLLVTTMHSYAAVVITAEEIGADVIFVANGTLNLGDCIFQGNDGGSLSYIIPSTAKFITGSGASNAFDYYVPQDLVGPGAFGAGTGVPISASSFTGDTFGIIGIPVENSLWVPSNYVSESPLNSTMTFSNRTFASLGLETGIYTWSWGNGATADTITLNIVPEPSYPFLICLSSWALVAARRRI